jgi:hypothetical protein
VLSQTPSSELPAASTPTPEPIIAAANAKVASNAAQNANLNARPRGIDGRDELREAKLKRLLIWLIVFMAHLSLQNVRQGFLPADEFRLYAEC